MFFFSEKEIAISVKNMFNSLTSKRPTGDGCLWRKKAPAWLFTLPGPGFVQGARGTSLTVQVNNNMITDIPKCA